MKILVLLILTISICELTSLGTGIEQTPISEFYSFEDGDEGWQIKGTDLTLTSGVEIPWSISRTQERADDGNTSFALSLESFNSKGKIWLEKQFVVAPNSIYDVTVEFGLASTGGDLGANILITGVLQQSPQSALDLVPAFKDLVSNEDSSPGVYAWAQRKYEFVVRTGDDGLAYTVIGMWGTSQLRHIIFVDSVRVTLTLRENCEFYSFENGLEGWEPKVTGFEINTPGAWSVAPTSTIWEDPGESLKLEMNGFTDRARVWIQRAFAVEPRNKYRVFIDYAFHSDDAGDSTKFRILTGVFRNPPELDDDFEPAVQEKTTNAHGTWGWLHKKYEFTIKSKKKDTLIVIIGIAATRQEQKSYNFDSLCVSIAPK